ncbi:MAG: type II toxin-antitoxin system HigB family toxin [Mesorhizobium sp.]|nr:MAG: type II toxin-antitoxin system HigB family toxin [Mesorhizobium sp.]
MRYPAPGLRRLALRTDSIDLRNAPRFLPNAKFSRFGNSPLVSDNRVIFDIAGNKYRVIVHVSYTYKRVLIKFVGTHAEYDKVDAETV